MNDFQADLQARLEAIGEAGLRRELHRLDSAQGSRVRLGGRELLNFSSNDYLGLANHPALREAAKRALDGFGAGSGASRLISGSLAPHHELEAALAAWKGTEAALTFSTGYSAAVGTITALLEKDDVVIIDKLVHASCVDAARLTRAKLRVFAHNDLDDLERILKWADTQNAVHGSNFSQHRRILIVTESVFSMDGDVAPLREMVELKERHGAWLMVDEAHASGLYGARRSGVVEHLGLSGRVEVQMGTLGKALGASGGCICGSRALVDFLVNRARSFIFSTAPVPAAAAAARAAVELVQSGEGQSRCAALWARVKQLKTALADRWSLPNTDSAILPLIIGDEAETMVIAAALRDAGFLVPGIRYPTVARGEARLRATLSSAHSSDDVNALADALARIRNPRSGICNA